MALPLPDETPAPQWDGVEELRAYKERLRHLSKLLIRTDWRQIKDTPGVIIEVTTDIRELIDGIESLRELDRENSADIEAILDALYAALKTIYIAADTADAPEERRITQFYEYLALCRRYLDRAIYAFPSGV